MMKATPSGQAQAVGAQEEPLGVLVVGAGHAMMALIKSAFTAGPLKPRHVLLLSVLSQKSPVTQQGLLEAVGVDPSVLVGLLNELEAEGVLARIRDPRDRRRHLVEISTHGRATYTALLVEIQAAEHPALKRLSDEERDAFRRTLAIILDDTRRARRDDTADC